MQLLVPFTLLLSLASAFVPNFPVCPFNLFSKYYLVFGPTAKSALEQKSLLEQKSALEQKEQEQFTNGMPLSIYPIACAYYGLRPANITADIVPELLNLLNQCLPTKQIVPGMWIETYEGLVPAYGCNALIYEGTVASTPLVCNTYSMPALCEVPEDPLDVTTTSVTDTETVTEETTTQETSILVSTETLTTFYVTHLTTVLTQGTNAYTTITTTSTACMTFTRTYTSSCCHHGHHHHNCKPCKTTTTTTSTRYITPTCDSSSDSSCSSSSSSSSSCCPPNHYLHRHRYPHGCHDCGKKFGNALEEELEWRNARVVKAQAAPKTPKAPNQLFYVQCPFSLNNFYLVRANVTSKQHLKSQELADINALQACAALGYNLANITIPILDNLYPLFSTCNITNSTNVVFNSYYSWMPLCGFLQLGTSGGAVGLNDVSTATCASATWALCRAGPTIATTLTVPTGPFTTETVVVVQTATEVVVSTVVVAETVTESDIATVTSTSYFPVTSTSMTTVPTTTVTSTTTSSTSCCCNPVVCTTVQECCKPKPICQKPHCRKH